MLHKLVEFALTQRAFVMFCTFMLAASGGWAYYKIPIDAFPDISSVQVKIIMKAPGMTPEEVETRVITPIELELLGVPSLKNLRSSAKYAIADITLDFEDGTDIYWARQQVTERLGGANDALPPGVSGGLAPISTPLSDVYMFTIDGGNLTLEERRTLLDWTIRPALRTIPGVADVNVLGGFVRTFEVVPDSAALAAAGVSIADIKEAIEETNRNDGAGRLSDGEKALVVRAEGAINTPDDLKQIVLRQENGRVLRLQDVAAIGIGSLTRYGAVTKDGTGEAVQGLVLSLRGSDASTIVKQVREKLESLSKTLPEGVTLHTFYDRSDLIKSAIYTVSKALLEATVLVVILLVLFLGDFRASIVVAVTLPLAALATFLLMKLFGMSANLMSLGGLAIAIGLIVDASVVVVENTVERLNHYAGDKHVPTLHHVYVAASEVVMPVASGILIICLVFLPLLSLEGLEGKLFAPVAITIILALSSSLLLSLTLIPALSSFMLRGSAHKNPFLMRWIEAGYRPLLRACLDRPWPVYLSAAAGTVAMVYAYMAVGKTFMPSMDEGAVIMQTTKLPSINLDTSIEGDMRIQRTLLEKVPEIDHIIARVGTDELGLDPMSPNDSDAFLVLKPKETWRVPDKEWLLQQLRDAMAELPGTEFSFTQPIEMRTSEMLTGARGDLAVKIFGTELDELAKLAGQVQKAIAGVEGASEVFTASDDTVDYLQIDMDRLTAGRTGLSVTRIEDELRALLEGTPVGIVSEGQKRTNIVIRGPETLRKTPELFMQSQMVSGDGGLARIGDVAKLNRTAGLVKVDRENAQRFAIVQAYVSGRDLVGFVEDAQKAVDDAVSLPAGYQLVWGGEFENQRRAATRLMLVVPVALGLIFVVLFATLKSVRQAVLILANIPFALIGGVLGLWISGEYLSVPASVGFIALLGIAVLNGLVLVSYFNQLLASGLPLAKAVYVGSLRRLRPVLMTASIAAFGLVPLLFASGPGSEIQKPLAIVVIGGLVTSTTLTLILLPILFRRFGAAARSFNDERRRLSWINPFAS
jgi:cobalt-zinc-cadmium resistance protein CzcA